jgi:hypothetical protein
VVLHRAVRTGADLRSPTSGRTSARSPAQCGPAQCAQSDIGQTGQVCIGAQCGPSAVCAVRHRTGLHRSDIGAVQSDRQQHDRRSPTSDRTASARSPAQCSQVWRSPTSAQSGAVQKILVLTRDKLDRRKPAQCRTASARSVVWRRTGLHCVRSPTSAGHRRNLAQCSPASAHTDRTGLHRTSARSAVRHRQDRRRTSGRTGAQCGLAQLDIGQDRRAILRSAVRHRRASPAQDIGAQCNPTSGRTSAHSAGQTCAGHRQTCAGHRRNLSQT